MGRFNAIIVVIYVLGSGDFVIWEEHTHFVETIWEVYMLKKYLIKLNKFVIKNKIFILKTYLCGPKC